MTTEDGCSTTGCGGTRHPNYFGDATVWWGLYLLACGTWPGAATVLAPIVMTVVLARGTGKPLTEKHLATTRPDYIDYVRRTSGFIPLPPRGHMTTRHSSVTRVIDAPAERIFDVLADPANHPLIDGSGSVTGSLSTGPRRLELGARFGMRMRLGLPYKILNTVVEFEDGTLIAWRHFFGHRWRWQLRDLGDGRTEVTETFDWSTARFPKGIELLGFPARNRAGIEATLQRLDEFVVR